MSAETLNIRIAGISTESVCDGPGLRSVVFFQGCKHHCPACHNPQTWPLDGGRMLSISQCFTELKLNPLISGVTFSGGEPFLQLEAALGLAQMIKNANRSLWIYTGYLWEELIENRKALVLLRITDVLVDGPYLEQFFQPGLQFRGSSNQRLIDVQKSIMASYKPILYGLD